MLALGVAETGADATEKAADLMSKVGLSDEIRNRHASELSGGQRQRVAIARVLCLNPQFIVLDEPTSALDVSVQAQVLNLLKLLKERHDLTYLLISHNLVVTLYMSDTIAVMYIGRVVELASADQIFQSPMHPYTYALLSAIPQPDPESRNLASVVSGDVPSAINVPSGCRFHTRCPYATQECNEVEPSLTEIRNNHHVACHHPQAWLSKPA
jgi:oligopeptide transport system ATP-binding protein